VLAFALGVILIGHSAVLRSALLVLPASAAGVVVTKLTSSGAGACLPKLNFQLCTLGRKLKWFQLKGKLHLR
jgi:hypothetical protein